MPKKSAPLRKIDAPHYTYLQTLYLALYSSKLYIDVTKRWSKIPFAYLLILSLIISIPFATRVSFDFNKYINSIINPLKNMPELMVQNGKLSLDKPMPYSITNSENKTVIIIDTSLSESKPAFNTNPNLIYLFKQTKLLYRAPPFTLFFNNDPIQFDDVEEINFDVQDNQIFDAKQWLQTPKITYLKPVGIVIIYLISITIFFSTFLMILLVFALMAQLIARIILKYNLQYFETVRLLIVAATPMSFLLFLIFSVNIGTQKMGISFIALLIYFCFAVLAIARSSKKLVLY